MRMDKDKKEFFKEQAEKFWDFRRKFRNGDLLSIFEKWCESKDFSDDDREAIFAKFLSQFTRKFLDKNYGH